MSDPGSFAITPTGPFRAAESATIEMIYTVGAAGLTKGAMVKVALPNNGWSEPLPPYPRECPEISAGEERRIARWWPCNTSVRIEADGEVRFHADHRNSQNIIGAYDNWSWWITVRIEEGDLAGGDRVVVVYGDTSVDPRGARVQPWAEKGRVFFSAFVDVSGSWAEAAGSPVECRVVPGPVSRCAVTLPSVLRPGADAMMKLTLTDAGHDATPEAAIASVCDVDGTARKLETDGAPSAPHGRSAFTPKGEGGRCTVQAETGEGIRLRGRSNPWIAREGGPFLFWGDLHCHSAYHMYNPTLGYGHACTDPAELIAYARDVSHLDFVALTDGGGALPGNIGWEEGQQAVVDAYDPGSFVTIKGWEVQFGEDGHRNALYRKAEVEPHIEHPAFSGTGVWQAGASAGMGGAMDYFRGREVILIPHHPLAWMNWDVYEPDLDRLVEIYSCWGSSEHRFNELWNKASPEGQSVRHGLGMGRKVGFVGGSDSHTGYVGRSIPHGDRYDFVPAKAGFTGVWAEELTRESVYDALRERRCYATTGARIIVDYSVDERQMGSDVPGEGRGERHEIRFDLHGTEMIRRVEVVRDGKVAWSAEYAAQEVEDGWINDSPEAKEASYYYLKVVQIDGNVAWASPVWA